MTILVTGGAGFIGSNLCERLLADNHQVICIDNLVTGRRANIEHLLDSPAFAFFEHDVIEESPALPSVDTNHLVIIGQKPITEV